MFVPHPSLRYWKRKLFAPKTFQKLTMLRFACRFPQFSLSYVLFFFMILCFFNKFSFLEMFFCFHEIFKFSKLLSYPVVLFPSFVLIICVLISSLSDVMLLSHVLFLLSVVLCPVLPFLCCVSL